MVAKRNFIGHKPTDRLNHAVNQLTVGEYEDCIALMPDRAYRRLIVWHRGRTAIDAAEEKAAFAGYDMKSLRHQSGIKLQGAIMVLNNELPSELKRIEPALASYSEAELDQLFALIGKLKAHAYLRGYFKRRVLIMNFEQKVVLTYLQDEKWDHGLQRIHNEVMEGMAEKKMVTELKQHHIAYYEKVKEEYCQTGHVNQARVASYFETAFAQVDMSRYSTDLRCAKLMLEETLLSWTGKFQHSSLIAETILQLNQGAPILNPREHARLLGNVAKSREALRHFEDARPEQPEHVQLYLKKYLLAMVEVALEADALGFSEKVAVVFERNAQFMTSSESDQDRLRIFLFLIAYYLSQHQIDKAKHLFDLLYREKEQKPSVLYRIQYMIAHLMLLYEQEDHAAMKSFGKNYAAFFREPVHAGLAAPALEVLFLLRKNLKEEKPAKVLTPKAKRAASQRAANFNHEMDSLIIRLQAYAQAKVTRKTLLYGPLIQWLESKKINMGLHA